MRVLVFASQKGGSGKSTLAASLAVAARQDGEGVVVVDLDPQESLASWGAMREQRDLIFRTVRPADLDRWLTATRKVPSVSLVILDTAGVFGPEVDIAVKHADFVLVPVRPSAFDLRAAVPTVERLRSMKKGHGFVLNGVNPASPGRTAEAVAALEVAGLVAPTIADRTDFRDSVATGLGATEVNPTGKAAAEVRDLWNWTNEKMKGAPRG